MSDITASSATPAADSAASTNRWTRNQVVFAIWSVFYLALLFGSFAVIVAFRLDYAAYVWAKLMFWWAILVPAGVALVTYIRKEKPWGRRPVPEGPWTGTVSSKLDFARPPCRWLNVHVAKPVLRALDHLRPALQWFERYIAQPLMKPITKWTTPFLSIRLFIEELSSYRLRQKQARADAGLKTPTKFWEFARRSPADPRRKSWELDLSYLMVAWIVLYPMLWVAAQVASGAWS